MTRTPPPTIALESRLAGWVLQHRLAQDFSFRSVTTLIAIERGDAGIAPADAHRLLHLAMQAAITAEVLAARQASAAAGGA